MHQNSFAKKNQNRILLVDDNTTVLTQVSDKLRLAGMDVKMVENGAEAIAALHSFPFHLVLLDWQMPVLSGYETAKAIRESDRASVRNIPIVAMTGFKLNTPKALIDSLNIDGFLNKPFTTDALENILNTHLKSSSCSTVSQSLKAIDVSRFHSEMVLDSQFIGEWIEMDAESGQHMVEQLVRIYFETSAQIESQIKTAFLHADRKSLAASMHKLKGSSGQIGAKRLMLLCDHVEKNILNLSNEELGNILNIVSQTSFDTQQSLAALVK